MKILQTQDGSQSAACAHLPGRERDRGALRGTGPDEGGAEDARVHQAQPVPAGAGADPRRRHARSPRPWPSAAISRRPSPEPALFGKGALAAGPRRDVEPAHGARPAVQRGAGVPPPASGAWRSSRCRRLPAWGEANKPRAQEVLQFMDEELGKRRFIAGDDYSVADITALVAVDFMRAGPNPAARGLENLARWHEEVSARPSAKA